MTSSKIQEIVLEYLADKEEHSVQEIKEHLNQCEDGVYTEGQFSGSMSTLVRKNLVKSVQRGIYLIKPRRESMRKAILISPVGEEGSEIEKRTNQLLKYIVEPVCDECEFYVDKINPKKNQDVITEEMLRHLKEDDLVIADMTGHNANVFYELGYRAALGKPVIYLKHEKEVTPFDVANIRTLDYNLSDLDSVDTIKQRLAQTIQSFNFDEYDGLEQEEYGFPIEIHNNNYFPILYEILDEIGEVKKVVSN